MRLPGGVGLTAERVIPQNAGTSPLPGPGETPMRAAQNEKINWGEKRISKRIGVSLAMLVSGRDKNGTAFEDTAVSYNVSRDGASFLTTRELQMSQALKIVIPRAPQVRSSFQPDFETTGEIRRIIPRGDTEYEIGVAFTGPRFRTFSPE